MTSLIFLFTLPAKRYETPRVEFLSFHSKWGGYVSTFKQWSLTPRLNLGQNHELIRLWGSARQFFEAENLCLPFAPAETSGMPSKTVNPKISSFWLHFRDIGFISIFILYLYNGFYWALLSLALMNAFQIILFLPFLCECPISHGIHLHAFGLKNPGESMQFKYILMEDK